MGILLQLCAMETNQAIIAMKTFMARYLVFNESEWNSIEQFYKVRYLQKGELLLKQGDVCKENAFVVSGAMRQFRSEDVDEYAYDFSFTEDYAVDFASFISGKPATISIDALTPSVLVCISKEDIDKAYQVAPVFQQFGRLMVERAYTYDDERVKSLLYDTAEERYLNLMSRDPNLLQQIPMYAIASYLGIRPESLSRVRANLSKKK